MRAVDGDRGINNPISYQILSGATDLFAITPESGIVYTQAEIDRESGENPGAFILAIRAYEEGLSGGEKPYVDTEVTIMIEVRISTLKCTNHVVTKRA